jgi:hypothetical protein
MRHATSNLFSEFHFSRQVFRSPGLTGRAGVARPTLGPTAEPVDLFIHGSGQRDGLTDGIQDMPVREVAAILEGLVQRAVDGFFNLGAAEIG